MGRVTIDDIVDFIREEAEKDYQMAAGISGDVEADDGVGKLTKARLPWLLIGMFGGIGAASIISGFGRMGDGLLRTLLYRWINRFNSCWIPDAAGDINIAGKLSHPLSMPNHYAFIGPLSRLNEAKPLAGEHLLVLLSGPEPQRTILENKLIDQLSNTDEAVVFVRGLPSAAPLMKNRGKIQFENHLDANALSEMLSTAKAVICRSGYSSVMDLLKLKKRALLIPTPGQTEQVYLAKHLGALHWFVVQDQLIKLIKLMSSLFWMSLKNV